MTPISSLSSEEKILAVGPAPATAGPVAPARGAGAEGAAASAMRVRKRNGAFESVDVNKIVRAVTRCCQGLSSVDPMKVATKTIGGLYDGATTKELFEELLDQPGELFFSVYYDNVDDRLYTSFDGGCSPDAVEETLEQHRGKL